ncbi:DL-methionine transporter subunit; periplasmic-binding component of ABC superfamily [uncultured Eubacteriales bacterium]|uniref:Lipoprotein n=1 Tax=uncultured Eubacteriales bacterium TaxID=172733 RepID=A0A212KFA4_9FIRM|nr:DL-methionine transporter subunit; periplasmic-binding component of ABC superfamily [uncultured Eubacteriales bacterium]
MKKKLSALALTAALLISALSGCSTAGKSATTIKVGATPAPHAEVLEVAKEILAKQNITLEIQVFDDYVLPNTALEEGDLDANYFQHITYLNGFNEEHGTHLVSVANIHYEPFAIYPGQTASLADLKDGDKIAVPNDGTNEARALLLLEAQGLLKLKEGVGLSATKLDIAENPHNYDIVEMEAKLLPSALPDVAVAIINGNYALGAGLTSDQALVFEDAAKSAEPYVNVLAVKEGNEDNEAIKALVKALQSDEVKKFMEEKYGSAVVPAF